MAKLNIFQRPGILLGTFSVLILVLGLSIMRLTIIEKSVMMVVLFISMIGGILYDAGAFNRFINKESELPDW